MSKIFVQIASYRDAELLKTLRDLRSKSSGQNHITIGLCWQKDHTESIGEFSNDSDVRVLSVDWQHSKGLGWARSEIQKMYNGEDYTLQLDSHHRFAKDWDSQLIAMYNSVLDTSSKPLLTSYAAGYDPDNDQLHGDAPCCILPHDFKKSGTIWFNPTMIPEYMMLSRPIRARFVSGHYFFTSGKHCEEYKYDPELYFAGDEIALSVRSYTMGYDLYHPHINVVWHYYGRHDKCKHWGDHNEKNKQDGQVEKTWMERDVFSKQKIRQLLGQDNYNINLGEYGLGNIRSLHDYELYSGIDFKNKRISKSAINGAEPPVDYVSETERLLDFKKIIPINIIHWNRNKFLELINDIHNLKLVLFNLRQDMIYETNIDAEFIKSNTILSTMVESDYVPMRYQLIAYNKNNHIIYQIHNDLRHGIHWN